MKEFSFFVLGAVIGGLWVKRSMDNAALKKENEALKARATTKTD